MRWWRRGRASTRPCWTPPAPSPSRAPTAASPPTPTTARTGRRTR
uniref:COMTL4 n=1 Tax=Arundo donax TaxID=35708 RepID=A0A0A9F4J9_ARUDO